MLAVVIMVQAVTYLVSVWVSILKMFPLPRGAVHLVHQQVRCDYG